MTIDADTGERVFRGIGVAPGVVRGRVVILDPDHTERPPRRRVEPQDQAAELERLQDALAETRRQISDIQATVRNSMGSSDAAIFDAHLLVIEDQALLDEVKRFIAEQSVNVEFAFYEVAEKETTRRENRLRK